MKRFLIDNAFEAWILAVKYCNRILDGECSLQTKKIFVSSLHNASELFLKQIMLDLNNHCVIKVPDREKEREPYKTFLAQTDLNQYFFQLRSHDYKKFYSVGYDKIKKTLPDILKDYMLQHPENQLYAGMGLIQEIRNQEMHFFIDSTFLNETDFEKLHNFMCELCRVIEFYHLLPFIGKPGGEMGRLWFRRGAINNFTYKKAIEESQTNARILDVINGALCPYTIFDSDQNHYVCDCLYDSGSVGEKLKRICSFEEFVSRMSSITEIGIIKFNYEENIGEDEGGMECNDSYYVIGINNKD